ncbi:type I-E CRISPR-associated protein Cse2/CasB [Streptomyces sp. BH-SS-21]|uniref:Type I-E CRISPR-associated protein Cse2/CasB n=1 Tax=Streptomyces liliiviolaceus TaxID=2823109 RepID=A0A940Y4F6_9ACTN|nr:type I-E CRISPR-associated protein Cse2/CasB [Streptomyces liliiviolaceus]MBQ0855413.1 type I-E CRISPR-associated protein Cse2/CasB [Streptomyces liliiviolaceus]
MTTVTATVPTIQRWFAQITGESTGEIIAPFQRGYLTDQAHAVAALARLRRGAGKKYEQVPDLWGLADTGPLHRKLHDCGRPPSEDELTRAEDAVHVALTLWALHQQSRPTAMHLRHRREKPRGLGAAVRGLMPKDEIAEPVRKRLVRAGTAPDLPSLAQRLRDLVLLLRGNDIALDYALLAEQLYRWQQPGGQDAVRRAWGRSFHAYRAPDDKHDPEDSASSTSPLSADTSDKDAS